MYLGRVGRGPARLVPDAQHYQRRDDSYAGRCEIDRAWPAGSDQHADDEGSDNLAYELTYLPQGISADESGRSDQFNRHSSVRGIAERIDRANQKRQRKQVQCADPAGRIESCGGCGNRGEQEQGEREQSTTVGSVGHRASDQAQGYP
jgi:hypothetical protein